MPSEARPQPLPTAAVPGCPRRTSSPHRDTPRFRWALGSRTPRGCVSLFTRGDAGRQSPEGAPTTPGEEQRGPGPRPPPATPIASRGAARHAPSPAPGPREMAAAPQNGSREGGTGGRRQPGPPLSDLPSHAVRAPPAPSRLAREGARGGACHPLAPGKPREDECGLAGRGPPEPRARPPPR